MSNTIDLNIPRDAAERLRVEEETGARYRERIVEIVVRYGARHAVQDVLIDALAAAMARMRSSELATKNARIAALEAWKSTCQEVDCYRVGAGDYEALRKELAEAKAALANAVDDKREAIKTAENAMAGLSAALEAANARIAEFADKGTLQALRDANNRAERAEEQLHYADGVADLAMKHRDSAEARFAELEKQRDHATTKAIEWNDYANELLIRAERAEAECKAMREALEKIAKGGYIAYGDIARAALNPSPAGREG